ncbi:YceI-like domain protein [compost metagenome]
MKKITFLLFLSVIYGSFAQERMITNIGIITFEASIPFFEEVKGTTDKAICILEPKTSKLTCVVIIKGFQFKRQLMKTHFNENYMESDKHSKATFKGKIEKFDLKNIREEALEYFIKGKIEIHGVTKNIVIKAKIKKVTEGVELTSDFNLNTDDFDIEIPFIVSNKISKNVNTQFKFVLQ